MPKRKGIDCPNLHRKYHRDEGVGEVAVVEPEDGLSLTLRRDNLHDVLQSRHGEVLPHITLEAEGEEDY